MGELDIGPRQATPNTVEKILGVTVQDTVVGLKIYSSLFNVGYSADGVGISRSRSQTSPSTSHNSVHRGILSECYSYDDKKSGHRSHTRKILHIIMAD